MAGLRDVDIRRVLDNAAEDWSVIGDEDDHPDRPAFLRGDVVEWLRVRVFDGPRWLTAPDGYRHCAQLFVWNADQSESLPNRECRVVPIQVDYELIWRGTVSFVTATAELSPGHWASGIGRPTGKAAHDQLVSQLLPPFFRGAFEEFTR